MTEDENAVRSMCTAYGDAMRAMDLPAIARLWDEGNAHLVYQPEEYAQACRTWDEVVAYWSHIPEVLESIREWREVESDVAVLGDVALVYSTVATSFQIKGVAEPFDGEARYSFGLRRTGDGWRFFHCHESRQLVVDDVPTA
ncbi:YybH family protein [Modestobacter sp. URMC 112]